jgi:poly(A) polymerase
MQIYQFLVQQSKQLQTQPQLRPPLLTGNDLIELGMKPGPAMGKVLGELREKQLQDELRTTAQAREWARQQMSQSDTKGTGKKRKRI